MYRLLYTHRSSSSPMHLCAGDYVLQRLKIDTEIHAYMNHLFSNDEQKLL